MVCVCIIKRPTQVGNIIYCNTYNFNNITRIMNEIASRQHSTEKKNIDEGASLGG